MNNENNLPFQVIGTRMNFKQNDIKRLKGYQYHQLVWFLSGKGIIKYNDKIFQLKSGTVMFMPKGISHEYYKTTNNWITNWICFSGWACDKLLDDLKLNEVKFFEIKNKNEFVSLFSSIGSVLKEDKLYGSEIASSLLYSLIIKTNRIVKGITNDYDKISCFPIIKSVKYLDENFSNKITIQELCKKSNLSESQLCRLFKKHLNMRPMEYLLKVRLNVAKQLLIETDLSILDIADSVGYDNPTYFTMLFKKQFGVPPTDFRKIMK